jgi:hypothetical protein
MYLKSEVEPTFQKESSGRGVCRPSTPAPCALDASMLTLLRVRTPQPADTRL